MNYGFFSNIGFNKNILDKIELLEQLMHLTESKHLKFKTTFFQGGIYLPKNYSRKSTDYFYRDKTTGCSVLFAGNIYNLDQISSPHNLLNASVTVPERMFLMYKNEGVNFVSGLNGDFSIAIHDPDINSFFLIRDHLGIIPLAYIFYENALLFSSDSISLCRVFHKDERINREFLMKSFKMIDFNQLPNERVRKVPPGHYLEMTSNGTKIRKYWFPEKIKTNRSLTKNQILSDVKTLVEKSVKIRSDKKYIAASHLSGGLDSGIVAALSRKEYANQSEFYGFSWSSEGKTKKTFDVDERKLVVEQCNLNDIKPIMITIDTSYYLEYLSDMLNHSVFFEENKVLEEARKRNIEIIFSGYGGDEFVSKGNRGIDSDLFFSFKWRLLLNRYPGSRLKALLRMLVYEIIMPAVGLLPIPVKKDIKLETQYLKGVNRKPHKRTISNFYLYKSRKQLQLGFLNCYYLPERIEDWYINAIRYGINYRYPLLDKDLIEYVLQIPSEFLFMDNYSRNILREISKEILPENVRWKQYSGDPVAYFYANKNIIYCSLLFINEIEKYKNNPDLDFIDFSKLEKDIENFRKNPDAKLNENLLYSIFDINQIHEFTKAYRNIN